MTSTILVIGKDPTLDSALISILAGTDHQTSRAEDRGQTLAALKSQEFDLAIAYLDRPYPAFQTLLQDIQNAQSPCPVVFVTRDPDQATVTETLRLGAFDTLCTPLDSQSFLQVTESAIRFKRRTDHQARDHAILRSIVATLSDAVVTVDGQGRFTHFNPAAMDHFGLTASAAGLSLDQFAPPCGRHCLNLLREVLALQKPLERYRQQCHNPTKSGQIISARCRPLRSESGLCSGALLVLRQETCITPGDPILRDGSIYHNLVGQSPEMVRLYRLLDKLAKVTSTVLLQGESGTGKELVAEALHYKGSRRNRPFVRVNCAGLSETLLDSELFGHTKGAFTGAIKGRSGRFEMAQGGTILLDEIGDISPKLQLKLLRVMQEKEIERLGDATPIPVDVRIIAATHQDLREKIRLGLFREDLYFRLRVIHLSIPPLRQRPGDIPLLVDHFVDSYSRQFNKPMIGVSDKVLQVFARYSWPGNVRELKHVLEHAFIFNDGGFIDVDDLPAEILAHIPSATSTAESPLSEAQQLQAALCRAGGNKAKAARALNISRQTLYRKLDQHGLNTSGDPTPS